MIWGQVERKEVVANREFSLAGDVDFCEGDTNIDCFGVWLEQKHVKLIFMEGYHV